MDGCRARDKKLSSQSALHYRYLQNPYPATALQDYYVPVTRRVFIRHLAMPISKRCCIFQLSAPIGTEESLRVFRKIEESMEIRSLRVVNIFMGVTIFVNAVAFLFYSHSISNPRTLTLWSGCIALLVGFIAFSQAMMVKSQKGTKVSILLWIGGALNMAAAISAFYKLF
jgi:hypothetical protein